MNERGIYLLYDPKVFVPILVFFAIFILTSNLFWLMLLLVYSIFIVIFYRGACSKTDEGYFLSPGHGKIIGITEKPVKDNDGNPTGDILIEISIFLNIHNVHIQYVPIKSKIISIDHKDGVFDFVFSLEKGQNNEKLTTVFEIQDTTGNQYTIEQIAGKLARSIINYKQVGAIINQGDAFGQIFLGSRVNVIFNKKLIDGDLSVTLNQHLKIGDRLFKIKK